MRALLFSGDSPTPSRWKRFPWQCRTLSSIISTCSPSPFLSYSTGCDLSLGKGIQTELNSLSWLCQWMWEGVLDSPVELHFLHSIFSPCTRRSWISSARKTRKNVWEAFFFVINVTEKQLQKGGWLKKMRSEKDLGSLPVPGFPRGIMSPCGICMERLTLESKDITGFFFQTSVYLPKWHKVPKIVRRANYDPALAKHLTQHNYFYKHLFPSKTQVAGSQI